MAALVAILIIIIQIFIVLWVTKLCARWFRASRIGLGWSFLAILLSLVFGGIVGVVCGILAFLGPIAGGLLALVLTVFVSNPLSYKWVLGTTYWRAFGIVIVSSLLSGIIVILLFLFLGFLGLSSQFFKLKDEFLANAPYSTPTSSTHYRQSTPPSPSEWRKLDNEITFLSLQNELESLTKRVCACKHEQSCITKTLSDWRRLEIKIKKKRSWNPGEQNQIGKIVNNRVLPCMIAKNKLQALQATPEGLKGISRLEQRKRLRQRNRADRLRSFSQKLPEQHNNNPASAKRNMIIIQPNQAKNHLGWPIIVTMNDGNIKEGNLEQVTKDEIAVRRYYGNGYMTIYLDLNDVKEIKVVK